MERAANIVNLSVDAGTGALATRLWSTSSWAALVLIPDLAVRWDWHASLAPWERVLWLLLTACSLTLWLVWTARLSRERGRRRLGTWAGLIAVASGLVGAAVVQAVHRSIFEGDLEPTAVAFFLRNPGYTVSLGRAGSAVGSLLPWLMPIPVLLWWMHKATERPVAAPRVTHRLVPLAVVTVLGAMPFPWLPASLDVETVRSIAWGGWLAARFNPELPRPNRVHVPPSTPREAPDVLIIIHESLSRMQVDWADGAGPTARFIDEHRDHTAWFPRATANSNITDLAIPSLFTGLEVDAQAWDDARAPLLWQDARARGYATGFFTSQDFDFMGFREFFLEEDAPDVHATAAQLGGPRVGDAAADDRRVVDAAGRFIQDVPPSQPLLLVVQFSATHVPCTAPNLPAPDGGLVGNYRVHDNRERCAAAAAFVDAQAMAVVARMDSLRDMERTLVIVTADHGETLRADHPLRLQSFREDVLGIPMFIHVPHALLERHPDWWAALRSNSTRRVSNLDIHPTLLDLWGGWPTRRGRPGLGGDSLLAPLPRRAVVAAHTGRVRARGEPPAVLQEVQQVSAPFGFAVSVEDWKWTLTDDGHHVAYRVGADAQELPVDWQEVPVDVRALFRRTLWQHPELMRMVIAATGTPMLPR